MAITRALLVPPQADLALRLAQAIAAQRRELLPDLSRCTILLPAAGAAASLRRCLFEAAGATLGPQLQTLPQFAAARGSGPAPMPAAECRLILVEALRKYRGLFPGQNPWQLAEALFALFEELSLNAVQLPQDDAAFAERLVTAYGARPLAALSHEAQIVHRLWRAFLEETGGRSPAAAYAATLYNACARLEADESVYLAGFDNLAGAERGPLAFIPQTTQARLWLPGRVGLLLHHQVLIAIKGLAVVEANARHEERQARHDAHVEEEREARVQISRRLELGEHPNKDQTVAGDGSESAVCCLKQFPADLNRWDSQQSRNE